MGLRGFREIRIHWGYMGIMEKKMETTIVYRGYIGIMESKMETTIYNTKGFRESRAA